jgi:dTDP-4-dehydrorhamnose 3,5-epimerase
MGRPVGCADSAIADHVMRFYEIELHGAFLIELDRIEDERGFFARAYCAHEFASHGLAPRMVQANLSFSGLAGTIRGMHYQAPAVDEAKLIRCIRGAVWDVIIDMRPDSPTYLRHFGVELTADNRSAIYVPPMFAHGNQALVDNSELFYLVGDRYAPECERGVRFDDPAVGIEWPLPVTRVSAKDRAWPLLAPAPC